MDFEFESQISFSQTNMIGLPNIQEIQMINRINNVQMKIDGATGDRSQNVEENVEAVSNFNSFINSYEIEFPLPQDNSSQVQIQLQAELKVQHKKPERPKKKAAGKKNKKRKTNFKTISKISDSKSETKNIPKNYGKQIIKFIKCERKGQLTRQVLKYCNSALTYEKFVEQLQKRKKCINKILDLKKMWLDFNYSKQFRILSNLFLRKHSLQWIFNSRIIDVKYPVKYRYKLFQGVKRPEDFQSLKQY